ncbi:ribosome recycling factor [Candidatus Beckwithbacteria bacterium]|nr:ribosome recycling factor [Candidatus Beckwithbacteria bacterium]
MNPILTSFQEKAEKVVQLLTDDLATMKTGRAKPSLVEHIKVSVYGGTWMEVRELASISAPDANHIIISPWDKSVLKDMEKGLAASEARLNPVVDGDIIRINIPPLTEERRQEFVKLVHQKAESHRAMVRNERRQAKSDIEAQKDQAGVSEDDIHNDIEQLQKITDDIIANIDGLAKAKEEELMQV